MFGCFGRVGSGKWVKSQEGLSEASSICLLAAKSSCYKKIERVEARGLFGWKNCLVIAG